jgi:phosphatidylglycerol---prolipoprotein diacylglyceryl transferase
MHPVLFTIPLPLIVVKALLILAAIGLGWYARRLKSVPKEEWIYYLVPGGAAVIVLIWAAITQVTEAKLGDPYKLTVHTYGLMIALGFLIGMQLGVREARRIDVADKKTFDQFIMDLTFWILLVAMAGSRLMFIIVEWKHDYSRDFSKIFRIWEGGLVFYGGFIASVLFSIWYSRARKRDFFVVADTLIPSVALGHFFGRLGCFAAGCCWGSHVDPSYPLAVQFPAGSLAYNTLQKQQLIESTATHTFTLHPVQLYEAFGELAIFFILIGMRTRKRFHGQVLLTYLFIYPLLRTTVEFMRGDVGRGENVIFGLSTSQTISVLVAIAAIATLIHLQRKRGVLAPAAAA